ncbi:MAG: PIN domain-containing protein [Chloroflexota bacterium]
MKLLLDTNIFLEIILDQERVDESKELLLRSGVHDFYLSDYSLHSIGLLLFRRNQHQIFQEFVQDAILNGGVGILSLGSQEIHEVVLAAKKFNLDFDDAYQYALAVTSKLTLVSFDKDFNRTDLLSKTPSEVNNS